CALIMEAPFLLRTEILRRPLGRRSSLGSLSVNRASLPPSGCFRTTTLSTGRSLRARLSFAEATGPQSGTRRRGFVETVVPFWPVNDTAAVILRSLLPFRQRSNLFSSGLPAPPSSFRSKVETGRSGTPVTVDLIRRP